MKDLKKKAENSMQETAPVSKEEIKDFDGRCPIDGTYCNSEGICVYLHRRGESLIE